MCDTFVFCPFCDFFLLLTKYVMFLCFVLFRDIVFIVAHKVCDGFVFCLFMIKCLLLPTKCVMVLCFVLFMI